MGNLRDAIKNETKWGETWNGANTLVTTSSKILDFFGRAGSMRDASVNDKTDLFYDAFCEDRDAALKVLFYTRDIRSGYGERDTFTDIFKYLANINKESVVNNLWAVLEFGRAKDLYCLIGTKAEAEMWEFMKNQFETDLENMSKGLPVSLLAKWVYTPNSKVERTKKLGVLTAKKLGYSHRKLKEYRKKLVELRKYIDIVESKIASRDYASIDYSKVPSKALVKYRRAFYDNDTDRYIKFFNKVDSGEAKINTGTLTPIDVLLSALRNQEDDVETIWKNLPDLDVDNALVMCDTSGSMWWTYNKVNPGDVAFSLAMYFAERNKGDLKNLYMTFDSEPKFMELSGGSISEKYRRFKCAPWGGSTNMEGAFDLLLKTALNSKLPKEDMPKAIIVVSDMQCDEFKSNDRMTFFDYMREKYAKAGYELPSIIFWNVNASNATFHASALDGGATLVSGYSVAIAKQVLNNIGKTPYDLLVSLVLENDRYKEIKAY